MIVAFTSVRQNYQVAIKTKLSLIVTPRESIKFLSCKLSECYFFTKTVQYRRLITEIGVFDGTSDL